MNAALLTRNDFKLEHGLKFKDFNFKHRLKAGKCLFHKVHVVSHLKTPECSNVSIYHQAPQNLVYFWIPKQERPLIDKNTRLTILLTGCQRRAAVMEQKKKKTLPDLRSFLKETLWSPTPICTHQWLQPSLWRWFMTKILLFLPEG